MHDHMCGVEWPMHSKRSLWATKCLSLSLSLLRAGSGNYEVWDGEKNEAFYFKKIILKNYFTYGFCYKITN